MTPEDKQLLLKDLSARLSYGVKILYTGWDCDSDTDFDTVETFIGIDDRFIYTVWDKTSDREKHCLSVSNWKPYLRPISSMTEEEKEELRFTYAFLYSDYPFDDEDEDEDSIEGHYEPSVETFDWYNKHHFDYRGLIEKGLAIAVTEENNPYKM